ncbi:MAG TPA: beta-ketoacyl synthase N-terminal-like domain-containing protein [Trebonia sp.]|nr:beta-ketoacyl synthase N-terminal-like domain-containing protein [Trebonia sp.]
MTTQEEIVAALRHSAKENQRLIAENAALRALPNEPIAVVSMACRLPGGVRTPEDMWRVLREQADAVSELPENRGWDLDKLYDPVPGKPGRCYTRRGGFLDCAGEFDPAFFGISPREATAMDPAQRLLLETTWEAVERAGIDPLRLRGSRTGVFAGVGNSGYYPGMDRTPPELAGYAPLGSSACVASGRIAYLLGLRGPAITLDTACSTALTAMHQASRALRGGDCDLALAAGGSVMAVPEALVEFSVQRAVAADGRCKPFAAAADGMVLGEGVGVVLLARRSHAERIGLPVLAVIRGSAINQDGASNGMTAPNGAAQREVIRAALADAGVSPAEVDVVEAHGTGTKLGDPIEADALLDTYGQDRAGGEPLLIGSLKSNFGHPLAAAGAASVIKMVLALRAGWLPATVNFDTPTPHVDWAAGEVRILSEGRDWPAVSRPRRAGVSSFGISGTNVHLILEQAAPAEEDSREERAEPQAPGPWLFPLSAKTATALRARAADLRAHLGSHEEALLPDVGFSLATTRSQFGHRAVVTARTREELRQGLDAIADGLPHANVVADSARDSGLAFVFAGQGTQRAGMGAELYERFPVFATALDEICAALDQHLEKPLREVMFDADPASKARLDHTGLAQPALFAFEAALYALLRSWGLRPAALVGHSIGELTAAYAAGVWTLPEAAAVVAARGRLMGALPDDGAMAALQADEQQVLAALRALGGRAEIAAVNGPSSIVVSGDGAAVRSLVGQWKSAGRKARALRVSHAFHSAQLDPMLAEFEAVVAGVVHRPPRIRVMSCLAPDADLTLPAHWVRQARRPVRFLDGVRAALDLGATGFVDLGPDGSAAVSAGDCLEGHRGAVAIPAVRADGSEVRAVQLALARIHARGADVDWDAVFADAGPRRVELPTYPFERRWYWWPRKADRDPAASTEPASDASETDGRSTRETDVSGEPAEVLSPAQLESLLIRNLAAVTGSSDLDSIELTTSFRDLGLTSVSVMELRQMLEPATGLSLPSSFAFDYPTPAALLDFMSTLGPGTILDQPPQRQDEDGIAIIGMACRYPGAVADPDGLWRLVADGVDAISGFPADRGWPGDIFHPDPGHPGTSYTREGGFLDDIAGFDPLFFGISRLEAQAMDPQQRLLLETAWEALEGAGVDPASVRGTQTGVFVGISMRDYEYDTEELTAYQGTGLAQSVASGRIAYTLGAQGPAMTVDTACSSSLVAMHLAAQSLRTGESNLALAGGATVLATPAAFVSFSQQRALAADGRCKAFGAGADGTGWAEGVGMLLLERVSDARRLGHRVLAVIRGSAVNSDGASNGLTAPNGLAQQRVIRSALADAMLGPEDIDLIEAHGTGTPFGDPVEANALLAAYGTGRVPGKPVWLGSLKSNIGHSAAAAGVGGVIKVVQAMRNGLMPKTLHAEQASPQVDWSAGTVRLLTEERKWPQPRRAAVSAFGISGTNAHVIIEQAEPLPQPVRDIPAPALVAVPVSGHSPDALRAQARRLLDHVTARPELAVADIGWSAATTRSALRHRAVVIAGTRAELADGLSAVANGTGDARVVTAKARTLRPVFLSSGRPHDDRLIKIWRQCGAGDSVAVTSMETIGDLVAQGHNAIIQLGHDPALTRQLRRLAGASGKQPLVIVSPPAGEFGKQDFLRALAQAHAHGMVLDWPNVFGGGVSRVELPTYAFQRQRYWPTSTRQDVPATPPAAEPHQIAPVTAEPPLGAPVAVGREQLLDLVVGLTAGLLEIPAGEIDCDDGFFQLGMDSLLATELRKELEVRLKREFPGTLLFEQPTVAALVDFLVSAVESAPAPAADAPPSKAPVLPDHVEPDLSDDDLSDDDLLAILEAEIEQSQTTRKGVLPR